MSLRIEDALARLHGLHPRLIDLSLDRLLALLGKLGDPHRRLPPVIHVAGTNGKGSTCAFLRAIAEAAGLRVHVYTSPHLVRFNERIRLADALVTDEALVETLGEVERINDGAAITIFEVITAAAFVLFARVPADLCVVEVGLGGRGDATNVIPRPIATAIASISMDHADLLGDTLAAIAAEKAGIMKPGVPVATGAQNEAVLSVLDAVAVGTVTQVSARGRDWTMRAAPGGWRYEGAALSLDLPPTSLVGAHQADNAGLAITALAASGLSLPRSAYLAGIALAEWPARLQRLTGRLAALLPDGWQLWVDGGHNPGAGEALGAHLGAWRDRPAHLVIGMKQSKDAEGFLRPLLSRADSVIAVREPGQHLAMPVEAIVAASGGVARPGGTVAEALAAFPRAGAPARVLVCGSLYLAGEVLKADA